MRNGDRGADQRSSLVVVGWWVYDGATMNERLTIGRTIENSEERMMMSQPSGSMNAPKADCRKAEGEIGNASGQSGGSLLTPGRRVRASNWAVEQKTKPEQTKKVVSIESSYTALGWLAGWLGVLVTTKAAPRGAENDERR